MDTKRLGRFHAVGKRILCDERNHSRNAGWHHLHVAVDDHSRIAYCEVLAGQGAEGACAFLGRAVAWFAAEHAITIERVLSDNGHAYRSHAWRARCAALGIERRYTRPYTPRTNGKAEALIGTRLREWAYRYAYPSSAHRTRALLRAGCGGTTEGAPTVSGQPATDQPCRAGPWLLHLDSDRTRARVRSWAARREQIETINDY